MFTKNDHHAISFERSPKHKQMTVEFIEFHAIVDGRMCEGVAPEPEPRLEDLDPGDSLLPEVQGNRDPLIFHRAAFALVGKVVSFPIVHPFSDSSDDYAKKMVASGNWGQIIPDEKYYKEQLKDHDILTWAFSEDGLGGCDGKAGMDGGNTTTGFLIKAAGDYPTLAYACCRYVPSGVFPLSEVLTNREKYGNGMKAKLIYIHRWIGS